MRRVQHLGPELLAQIRAAVREGDTLHTVGRRQPNRIVSIDEGGIRVETDRSRAAGVDAPLVPAWMVAAGWERLASQGRLSGQELTNELGVKRSAFVCALLAQLPGVEVESTRPVVLRMSGARG